MPAQANSRTTRRTHQTRTARASHAGIRTSNRTSLVDEPTEDQIRQRAYEIYLARGAAPGSADADWRQAEQELRSRIKLFGRP